MQEVRLPVGDIGAQARRPDLIDGKAAQLTTSAVWRVSSSSAARYELPQNRSARAFADPIDVRTASG
jgi:hypothetical protein